MTKQFTGRGVLIKDVISYSTLTCSIQSANANGDNDQQVGILDILLVLKLGLS